MRAPMLLLKWLLIFVAARLGGETSSADGLRLGPIEKPRPRELSLPMGADIFDAAEALQGTYASPERCAALDASLWLEIDGRGDCIRYYAKGLEQAAGSRVLVYFPGDVIMRGSDGVRFITTSYDVQSPASVEAEMSEWSQRAGEPAIFLARPGIYGSSGDHNARRLPREIDLMNAALDALKRRHGIGEFILAGQSGGGHVVASLLNRRGDIAAAVISSGLVSVRQVMDHRDRTWKVPESIIYRTSAFYDPITEVERIRRDPPPEIYVISDPEDRTVPFVSQLRYVRRLRAEGFHPRHLYAHASDRNRHSLARHARLAAAMIARGETVREIAGALSEIDFEQME